MVDSCPSSNDLRLSQAKLPAAKVLIGPLSRRVALLSKATDEARRLSESEVANSFTMEMTKESTFTFCRAWVQGVVVAKSVDDAGKTVAVDVDDGTGVIKVDIRAILKKLTSRSIEYEPPEVSSYVMSIGKILPSAAKVTLKAHKLLHVKDPNREPLWHAECLHHFQHVLQK